ncbi:MAG: hypothetical protein RQ745_04870 [Longimicrobiales bacterium]|nr:hypothetical protein [Longimicrobiales bacterium]
MTIKRQLELQDEIDSIHAEVRKRRTERTRSRFVAFATLLVAGPLLWTVDFPGRPDRLVSIFVLLIVIYAAGSFAYAEISTIGFLASAKQRLDRLTSSDHPSPDP